MKQRRSMHIQLSDHFTYQKLLRFTAPSIMMMIFTSIYGVVDGFFVSNYVGKTEFAAVNLIMPFPMLLGAFGFMIGTGGSALVAMKLGEGKKKEANEFFSMLIKVTIIVGVILSVLGIVFTREIAIVLGATDDLLEYCVIYGRVLLIALTAFMLQNVFQSFLVTAEKPKLGLLTTVIAGLTNVVLDFVMIGVLKWGIVGAALAIKKGCKNAADAADNMQKALLDKMQGYIGHILSDWFKQEYQGLDPVTVIHFEEEPHQLVLQLLSKCIAWFNDYGIELRFKLEDSYFNITQSEE